MQLFSLIVNKFHSGQGVGHRLAAVYDYIHDRSFCHHYNSKQRLKGQQVDNYCTMQSVNTVCMYEVQGERAHGKVQRRVTTFHET